MEAEGSRAQPSPAWWVSQSWAALRAGACAGEQAALGPGCGPQRAVSIPPPPLLTAPPGLGPHWVHGAKVHSARGSFSLCPACIYSAAARCSRRGAQRAPVKASAKPGAQDRGPPARASRSAS